MSGVSFLDLQPKLERRRDDLIQAFTDVLDSNWLVLGPRVREFEERFAAYVGSDSGIGVANGTDALEIALVAVGVDDQSTVATAANAGMYASTAIRRIGAEPSYLEIDQQSHIPTLAEVERALSMRPQALVITHLYGRIAPDIIAIAAACRDHDVPLIEDCAQAHGARLGSNLAGSFGTASCFSFYPTKNLGALGDGGMICTSERAVEERARSLRQYGWQEKYQVGMRGGCNSRLDEVQAAFLIGELEDLDQLNGERLAVAKRYVKEISHPHVQLPAVKDGEYVAHLFVIMSEQRDELANHLTSYGVQTAVHFPIPDTLQATESDHRVLPVTEQNAQRVLSLPCYPGIPTNDVDQVIAAVNSWQPAGSAS